MQTRWKVLAVALPLAILGFMINPNGPIGQAVWPTPPPGPDPTGPQIALLVAISLLESLAFGLGFAFLLFGRSALDKAPGATKGWATAAYFAIGWGLISWVPHSSMHITNGDNYARLIVIEYLFHATLIVAAGVLAMFFVRTMGAASSVSVRPAEPRKPMTAQR